MSADAILAIDQGTTNTKALLVNREGAAVFRASVPVKLRHDGPECVEQDAEELWQSVVAVMRQCARHAASRQIRVCGIAISNQRETALAWRAGPKPCAVAPAISWQCRRSTEICQRLAPQARLIESVTGLPLDPLSSAGKWAWLCERIASLRSDVADGNILLGNVDAWLLANLTSGQQHATDHSNASRTGVCALDGGIWSERLLELYDLPKRGLPTIRNSASAFGVCRAVEELAGVPIVAMIGDSHAAMVGHGSYAPGSVKATYGTGSSLMMLTGELPAQSPSVARTVAWSDVEGVRFALEGNIAMAGAAVQWVGEFLGLQDPTAGAVALAGSVSDAQGLRFVPAMVGLGAPYWDTDARGLVTNLGPSHTAAHLARAAIDAIAFQVADVVASLEESAGTPIVALLADGGATRNDALMQFQADLLGKPVLRSADEELSALGAAFLGGITLGWWRCATELESLPRATTRFEPQIGDGEREELRASWQTAVNRARLKGSSEMRA